jgi:UDP-N-acetyl-D-mannosaminuronic acid dehydrogenase
MTTAPYAACVVGGAGHVGAPLAIVMAMRGLRTLIYDLDRASMDRLADGVMPFVEEGAEPLLKEALAEGRLGFTTDPADIRDVPYVVITIGTPVDHFHNPVVRVLTDCLDTLLPHLSDRQTLILRSTISPGVTEYVHRYLSEHGRKPKVAFCPERVVQGRAVQEIQILPQIVSGTTPEAEDAVAELFGQIAPRVLRLTTKEAELAKLFSNTYRYIQFAAANQLYMIAEAEGANYPRLYAALKDDYPRMRDLPGPGFAAGPCLYKDTLQLVSFCDNGFSLGRSAIEVNEGLPAFVVAGLSARYPLETMTVGLIGMAFKADSDDIRSSLSYKVRKLLQVRARRVLITDPFVKTDPEVLPLDDVIRQSDVLVLGAPHSCYKGLDTRGKPVVDIWNFLAPGGGGRPDGR